MNVVRAINKTLKESRGDYGRLTAVERHVQRADVFDSYATNDGFDVFDRELADLGIDLEELIAHYVGRHYPWAD